MSKENLNQNLQNIASTEAPKPINPLENHEVFNVGNCRVINLSGKNWYNEIQTSNPKEGKYPSYPKQLLDAATNLVVMPDFCEGRSIVPTGSTVTIDKSKCPEWRKFAVGDVGCGMHYISTNIPRTFFMQNLHLWDEVAEILKKNKGGLGDLGSGNHFLDALSSSNHGFVSFLIHTGSRDESKLVDDYINDPKTFDQKYKEASQWAKDNRFAVAKALTKVYQKYGYTLRLLFDNPHNLYFEEKDQVTIYKGANRIMPGQWSVIPSSMLGGMALVQALPTISEVNYGLLHGTGRLKSRGEMKDEIRKVSVDEHGNADFSSFRLAQKPISATEIQNAWAENMLYIPDVIGNSSIVSEVGGNYRPLPPALQKVKDFVTVYNILKPIAYIGQL